MADYTQHEGYKELKEYEPEIAQHLLDKYGEGGWQNSTLTVFDTLEDFAIHEVEDGWYNLSGMTFNGAHDLLNFIDYEALGEALMNTWDETLHECYGEKVITTDYGF